MPSISPTRRGTNLSGAMAVPDTGGWQLVGVERRSEAQEAGYLGGRGGRAVGSAGIYTNV